MPDSLFDKSGEYDAMLEQGVKLSGERKDFFMCGRVLDLKKTLPDNFKCERILDYGCGVGDTTQFLSENFPESTLIGMDTAQNALNHANKAFGSERISFSKITGEALPNNIDLCYTNGVFHHIPLSEREAALRSIHKALNPGGYFALFENNPWNVGTRLVMSRIPFDRDAITITPPEAKRMLKDAGFEIAQDLKTLFYFPRPLAFLRFLEPTLAKLPLGAQYYFLVRKPQS